jgi:hypothetical protein
MADGEGGDDGEERGGGGGEPATPNVALAEEAGLAAGAVLGSMVAGGASWPPVAAGELAGMTDAERERAFIVAARDAEMDRVVELVQRWSVPVDYCDANRSTALHFAAARGHTAVGAFLLDSGAQVDWADVYGTTALHGASWCGHPAFVELLLSRGADPLAEGGSGMARLGDVQWYRKRASHVICLNHSAADRPPMAAVTIRVLLTRAEAWARRRVAVVACQGGWLGPW